MCDSLSLSFFLQLSHVVTFTIFYLLHNFLFFLELIIASVPPHQLFAKFSSYLFTSKFPSEIWNILFLSRMFCNLLLLYFNLCHPFWIYNFSFFLNSFLLLLLGLIIFHETQFFFFCLFVISWAACMAYGGSQARGWIWVVAASLCQSHSNAGSEHSNIGSQPRL